MMAITSALQLYPSPGTVDAAQPRPLAGLYLEHGLQHLGSRDAPLIYANFVASLDGRIALPDEQDGVGVVPSSLTTASDWQLFQELQAQADCFVVHGGYLRALAQGRLDDILQVGVKPEADHLLQWRRANGLPEQPLIVVISSSLTFPLPASLKAHQQRFCIVAPHCADRTKLKLWRSKGLQIVLAGDGPDVDGAALLTVLQELGVRSVYLQAGPLIAASLLRERLLSRLYLTTSHQLLGGDPCFSLGAGAALQGGGQLRLRSLFFAPQSQDDSGQFFACYEPSERRPGLSS